jgi:hypothetical protein
MILRIPCTVQKKICENILSLFDNLKILNAVLMYSYRLQAYSLHKRNRFTIIMYVISFSSSSNFHMHKRGRAIAQEVSRWCGYELGSGHVGFVVD